MSTTTSKGMTTPAPGESASPTPPTGGQPSQEHPGGVGVPTEGVQAVTGPLTASAETQGFVERNPEYVANLQAAYPERIGGMSVEAREELLEDLREIQQDRRKSRGWGRFDFTDELVVASDAADPRAAAERVLEWAKTLDVPEAAHLVSEGTMLALREDVKADLGAQGWHPEDVCEHGDCWENIPAGVPAQDRPEYPVQVMAGILTDWHDRTHGLSLWSMCTWEPCNSIPAEYRATPAVHQ